MANAKQQLFSNCSSHSILHTNIFLNNKLETLPVRSSADQRKLCKSKRIGLKPTEDMKFMDEF